MQTLINRTPIEAENAEFTEVRTGIKWPAKRSVFGVNLTPTTYDEAVDTILASAKKRESAVVSCHAVHALMTFSNNEELRSIANSFDMITPDGQPVRWALNCLHGAGLQDRVYGPELTIRLCQSSMEQNVPIYLYGGSPSVVERLVDALTEKFPHLSIAGYESPPYRVLSDEEVVEVADRIKQSGAGMVFIGLGCPKQDIFAHRIRNQVNAVQVCVGAAFDFHAGVKSTAPRWMQRLGLEWLFRLAKEPRRLWRRYLVTNSQYLFKLSLSLLNVPQVLRQHREHKTSQP